MTAQYQHCRRSKLVVTINPPVVPVSQGWMDDGNNPVTFHWNGQQYTPASSQAVRIFPWRRDSILTIEFTLKVFSLIITVWIVPTRVTQPVTLSLHIKKVQWVTTARRSEAHINVLPSFLIFSRHPATRLASVHANSVSTAPLTGLHSHYTGCLNCSVGWSFKMNSLRKSKLERQRGEIVQVKR